jgi:hypothetical protein
MDEMIASLIHVAEVLAHDVGVIRFGVPAENAKEVVAGYDLVLPLRSVIQKECEESLIANARAEFV